MPNSCEALTDIVLVGAGHAHVGVLRSFGISPAPGVRLTLITPRMDAPYSGMLPGVVAGHYAFRDAHIDVGPLCRFAGARLRQGAAVGLDLARREVLCEGHPPVPYDLLSINIGSTPDVAQIPGASENAIPVKPIDGFLARFEAARARILAAGARARIGVVGGGAGGTELALSLERRLRADAAARGLDPRGLRFAVLTPGDGVLPGFPPAMRRRFMQEFARRGVEVLTGARVAQAEGGVAHLEAGGREAFDELFWATSAAPAPWLAGTALRLDKRGFIAVAETLQTSDPAVFAAGDVAGMEGRDLPKAGVYAVRQGPALALNLRLAAAGRPLAPHTPQRNALYLISTGERYAIGTRNGVTFEGAWVWRLKDIIDRRFMAQFRQPPETLAESGGPASARSRRAKR